MRKRSCLLPVIGQFFFSAGSRLPDLKKIRQKDERDFSGDHEGGKGIDFRRNPSLHHGVDVKRESCRIRSGCEEADDEVIDGQCESDERARSDSRHDEGSVM